MIEDPKPRQDLIRSRCSTHDFLLSKTDAAHQKKTRGRISTAAGLAAVTGAFPEIRHGKDFFHQAAVFIEPLPRFDALAIRIDHFLREVTEEQRDPMATAQKAVASTIDGTCRETGGLWGVLDEDIFGCFFPCKGEGCGERRSERIRSLLKEQSSATISVGIAEFPTLSFERAQILENALKALDHAAFFGPDTSVCFDAVSLNISGDQLYQNGDVAGAAEEYRLALQIDPDNVNVHNSLGVCYGLLKEYDKALASFSAANRLASGEVMATYNTGVIHMLKAENEHALKHFKEAAAREPDIFEVVFQTGRIYLDSDMPAEAVPHLKKATVLNPEAAAAHRLLGEALEATGDIDGAVDALRMAIKKNPNDAAALSALGLLLDRRGEDPEIAELFCRQSTEIEPGNGLYQRRLGELYLRHEVPEQALEAFRKASEAGTDCSDLVQRAAGLDQN